jgi:hypothetical protein
MHSRRTRQDQTAVQLELFGWLGSQRPSPTKLSNDRLVLNRGRQFKPRIVSSNGLSLADHMDRCGYGAGNQNDYE